MENSPNIANQHIEDIHKKAFSICVNDLKSFIVHNPMVSLTDLGFEFGISIEGLRMWLQPLLEENTIIVVLKDGQQFIKLNLESAERFRRLGTTLNHESREKRIGKATLLRLQKQNFTKSSQTLLDIIDKHGAITAKELSVLLKIDETLVKKWAHDLELYGMLDIDFEGEELLIKPKEG